MSIQSLSQSSIRSMGSGQVITTPLTVLKELIENALDAAATTISLEATPDLMSVLTVRDNGTGILPEDRPLMALPHCTSKIEKFEDLSGVSTLGFRGEALASLATVSGGLTISTKVEKETVGVGCEIGQDGKIIRQSTVSMPRGTTVKVTSLFATIPVRRATVEKTAGKTLPQIRPLLVSYYLTHPHVRLSFKLVAPPSGRSKGKKTEDKYNVVFASSKTVEEAFMKSIGKDAAAAGLWKGFPPEEDLYEDHGIQIEAFVACPGANGNHISKKGAYISFLRRPLSLERAEGVAKQIYSLYKKYIKATFSTSNCSLSEPFIYLNILTNRSAADVNIEPAKDDILFEDTNKIMKVVQRFFDAVYGELPVQEAVLKKSTTVRDFASVDSTEFNVLLSGRGRRTEAVQNASEESSIPLTAAQQMFERSAVTEEVVESSPVAVQSQPEASTTVNQSDQLSISTRNTENDDTLSNMDDRVEEAASRSSWAFNMFDSGNIDEEGIDAMTASDQNDNRFFIELETEDISTSNPWTMSKMNANTNQRPPSKVPNSNISTPMKDSSKSLSGILTTPASILSSQRSSGNNQTKAVLGNSTCQDMDQAVQTPSRSGNEPWYPGFGTRSTTRRQTALSSNVICVSSPLDLVNEDLALPSRLTRPGKRKDGLDSWIGRSPSSDGLQTSEQINVPRLDSSPLMTSFGRPELRMSNIPGDGGRGIFPSASNRMQNRAVEVEDDDISDDDNVEIIATVPHPRSTTSSGKGNTISPHKNRQRAARAALEESSIGAAAHLQSRPKLPVHPWNQTLTRQHIHDVVFTWNINLNIVQELTEVAESAGNDDLWHDSPVDLLENTDELRDSLLKCIARNMERLQKAKPDAIGNMPTVLVSIWKDASLTLSPESNKEDEIRVITIK